MRVLVLTTCAPLLQMIMNKDIASHSLWGVSELIEKYEKVEVKTVSNVFSNTKLLVFEDFDALYMHNWNPTRFFPLHILKFLIPSLRKKKVICLCHASIYGKGHSPNKWAKIGWVLTWMARGYDKLLFFSPKSMSESIKAGIFPNKCQLVHWGANLEFVNQYSLSKVAEPYYLSTGKENRDFKTMCVAKELLKDNRRIEILQDLSQKETYRLASECRGILVIINKKGLNYCTGLTCIMEAFALGKPIIAVKNPYYPFDIEKEGCGIYVDVESPQQIVDAIVKIESDKSLYYSMCDCSRKMSAYYNMERFGKELISIIES